MGGNGHRARVHLAERQRCRCAKNVTYTRIDSTSTAAPSRFVSGIIVDPTNANRAWLTYSGYNTNTPTTPGHVFQVDYNPSTHTATWTDIDNGTGPIGDLPVTGIARDAATGTLYVATDFTVLADTPAARPAPSTGTGGPPPTAAAGRGGRRDARPEVADAVRRDPRPLDLDALSLK